MISYCYTTQGYAIKAVETSNARHWFGGEPYHSGAKCPVCKVPLLLLVDLDCTEIRKHEKSKLFHTLERLPLYYCWRCCAEKLTYKILDSNRIKIFRNEGSNQGGDFPYPDFPQSFEKRPVALVPIDYEISKLLIIAQEVGVDCLRNADKRTMQDALRHLRDDWFSPSDINRHQIGGFPNLIQSHDRVSCPNPKCRQHKLNTDGYAAYMKELAVIHDDPQSGLPMVESLESVKGGKRFNEWVQVVYWVCEECFSIAASNRCD